MPRAHQPSCQLCIYWMLYDWIFTPVESGTCNRSISLVGLLFIFQHAWGEDGLQLQALGFFLGVMCTRGPHFVCMLRCLVHSISLVSY